MPIKGQKPREVVRTEMRKFSEGKLHTGSPKGRVVTDRKQAIAIGLSEARKAPGGKRAIPPPPARRRRGATPSTDAR